jgi:hypothetical protein
VTVQVTSPIDTILDLGATPQLNAAARDQAGKPVTAQFDWQSSNANVLNVSTAGAVTAQGTGTATITATVRGSGVGDAIRLRVVQADLATASILAGDARGALVAALSAAKRAAVQTDWGRAHGWRFGNIVAIKKCG